jgi:hypothetical protein
VDPWLVDELVFFNQTWLYRGKKGALPPVDVGKVGEEADVIILSQACHSMSNTDKSQHIIHFQADLHTVSLDWRHVLIVIITHRITNFTGSRLFWHGAYQYQKTA